MEVAKNIVVVGNGFDLRHSLKTSYNDFYEYFAKECPTNIYVIFFGKMHNVTGWYDFENHLLVFTELLTEIQKTMKNTQYGISNHTDAFSVGGIEFVNSQIRKCFIDSLKELKDIFKYGSDLTNLYVAASDDTWHNSLIDKAHNDFCEMRNKLQEYLSKINQMKCKELVTSEIDLLKNAVEVISFNYTDTISKYYNSKSTKYAHGSLNGKIIFGIPFSNKMRITKLQSLYKISQVLIYDKCMRIENVSSGMNLVFLGFSFGIADHYFFQEIKDKINSSNSRMGDLFDITFTKYYYNESENYDFLNNLRIFLGLENFVRYSKEGKIRLIPYNKI